MRGLKNFPVGPDVLFLVAVISLVTVVFLCGLPGAFHSLSHRKATAADLITRAHEHIVKEGNLFASLIHAADDKAAARLRQQLVENERAFHEIAAEVDSELPEAKLDIEAMVGQFDHLAAIGWQVSAVAPQSSPEARETLLEGAFSTTFDELRARSEQLALNLRKGQDG